MDQMIVDTNPINLRSAKTFFERALGLFACQKLAVNEGLVIEPCACIHTFFMPVPIDVLFFDRQRCLLKRVSGVLPWRVVFCRGAFYTIEFRAGYLQKSDVEVASYFLQDRHAAEL
jgi:uncharacterized protein